MSQHVPLGLHHVTAIAGAPRPSAAFYAGVLGLRRVKLTVNFDDPGAYHVYYADDAARPGSVLTLFPYGDAPAGRPGAGDAVETAHAVPAGALEYWMGRLADKACDDWDAPEERLGEPVLRLRDPDGVPLALVETPAATGGWEGGPVPLDAAAGALHSVSLASRDPDATMRLLTEAMGYDEAGAEGDRVRLVNARADRAVAVDVVPAPGEPRRPGRGTIHHVAFRVVDDEALLAFSEAVLGRGLQPTEVRDRKYFHSIYFREPGGVLFEAATDGPGFALDEVADALGLSLQLPAHLEARRAEIEAALPALD